MTTATIKTKTAVLNSDSVPVDSFITSNTGEPDFLLKLIVNGAVCDVVGGKLLVSYGGEHIEVMFSNG